MARVAAVITDSPGPQHPAAPDYVAEFNRSAIFIWEFKDSIKRLVATLNRGPETERSLPGLIDTLNQGRYKDDPVA